MPKKPPPAELVATRPHVALEDQQSHPAQGPVESRLPARYSIGVHEQIIANIEKGNDPRTAAGMAGIPSNTYYQWMSQGKAGHPHLWKFAEDVELASARFYGKLMDHIAGTVKGVDNLTPDNARYLIERRLAEFYSKEAQTKVNAQLEEFFHRLETNLPPEIFQLVIAAAAGQNLPAVTVPALLTNGDEEETSS